MGATRLNARGGWQGRPAGRRSWHLSVIGAQPERGPSLHLGICDASSPYHLWYGSPERDTNRQNGYGGGGGLWGQTCPAGLGMAGSARPASYLSPRFLIRITCVHVTRGTPRRGITTSYSQCSRARRYLRRRDLC